MNYAVIKDLINNTETKEKITYLFLFLFPIAGPVVRHWNSSIFTFILLFSIYIFFTNKNRKPILKEEKIFLSAFSLFFLAFLISAFLNDWNEDQTIGLGVELRFLLVIPLYLLVREYEYSLKVLFAGIIVAVPIIFIFSIFEFNNFAGEHIYIEGAYSRLFISPITALFLLFSFSAYRLFFTQKISFIALLIVYVLGLFVIGFSGARVGYLTISAGSILMLIVLVKNFKIKMTFLIILIIALFSIVNTEKVNKRIIEGVNDVKLYLETDGINQEKALGSFDFRLEMWRASQYAVKEHPIFGLGRTNFTTFIVPYIERGEAHQQLTKAGQLHNSFVDVMVTKGLFGLFLLLLLFYYPLYVAWKNRSKCKECLTYVFILSTALTLMSVAESMLITKNNGSAHFLIFTLVIFSFMMRKLYPANFKAKK